MIFEYELRLRAHGRIFACGLQFYVLHLKVKNLKQTQTPKNLIN